MDDYQQYVIKDGRLVGAFEEMYQRCEDPWHQDSVQGVAEEVALLLVGRYQYQRVVDLGCGRGRFTGRLRALTGGRVTAVDMSPTAIEVARSRHQEIEFLVGRVPPLDFPDEGFDLVVSAELLWYVLPELSALFAEIRRVLRPGGHYLVIQQFYRPEEQEYGKEIMQAPQDLLRMLPFRVLHHVEVNPLSNRKFVALAEKTP